MPCEPSGCNAIVAWVSDDPPRLITESSARQRDGGQPNKKGGFAAVSSHTGETCSASSTVGSASVLPLLASSLPTSSMGGKRGGRLQPMGGSVDGLDPMSALVAALAGASAEEACGAPGPLGANDTLHTP